MKDYWRPIGDGDDDVSRAQDQMKEMLRANSVSGEIAEEVVEQLSGALEDFENNDIIFVVSDNDNFVITGIHVPAESLNGQTGPVLMRGKTEKSIIAAFSRESITEILEKIDSSVSEKTGLPGFADAKWVNELERLAEMAILEMRTNPPEEWDELLGDR